MGWLAGPEDAARQQLQASRMALLVAMGRRDATAAVAAANDATTAQHKLADVDAVRVALLSASESKRVKRASEVEAYVEAHRKDPQLRPPAALLGDVEEFAVGAFDFRWAPHGQRVHNKR